MLTLDHVAIWRGDFHLTADFELPPGGVTAVIGPSGAGKSTLLGAIAGFEEHTGVIRWQGRDLTGLAPADRPVAMLFQDQNLFAHMTAAQNVALALTGRARLTDAQRDRVEAALDRVGLAGLGDRKPGALSGGQQGRVALARVLLQDRPLLLLDEPFAALGPALRSEMLALVADLAAERGTTVLMVSHDPGDALAIAGQAILVADGIAHPPEETGRLFADPPPALAAYLGATRPGY